MTYIFNQIIKMSKLRKWTDEELELVIKNSYELRLDDPEPSLLQIINIVQDSLFEPKNRKSIKARNHAIDIIDGVKALLNEITKPGIKSTGKSDIQEIKEELKHLDKRITKLNEKIEKIKPKSRPKILIIGLIGPQQADIQKRFGSLVKLSMIDAAKESKAIPDADYVITVTSFMNHRWWNILDTRFSRNQIISVTSISDVVTTIDRILNDE